MSDVVMYDLALSPNNTKVRIALNYKGIPFERIDIPVDDDRARLVEVSGQPLAPVIRHGDAVIADSAAILRYLDANFPGTPKILFTERSTMMEANQLEKWILANINEPPGMIFTDFMSGEPDASVGEAASALLHERTADFESRLESRDYLMSETMSFVDITAAPFVAYGMVPEAAAAQHEIAQHFRDHLNLGADRERTRAWVTRVMAHDRP